jgi:hypothetical protein
MNSDSSKLKMILKEVYHYAIKLFFYFCAAIGYYHLLFWTFEDAKAATIKRVVCEENKMVKIYVRPNTGTIINFPVKPENVVLMSKNQFGVEYIRNDIAVSALSTTSKTNLFVYMTGRRCGFQLVSSAVEQNDLVEVRDSEDSKMKVEFK